MLDNELRNRFHDTLRDVATPPHRIEDVYRRVRDEPAGPAGRGRRVGLLVAAVIIGAAALFPLAALLPLGGRSSGPIHSPAKPRESHAETLAIGGIRVVLPEGWNGRVYYLRGYIRPVIHLATVPLPEDDDITASSARALMGPDDVLVALTERGSIGGPWPGYRPTSLPLSLADEDFETPFDVWHDFPPQDGDVPDTHDFARRTFVTANRNIDMWVEFGQVPASEALLSDVDQVLASVEIGGYEPPPQPDGICTDWIESKDPDCSQTVWLQGVASKAGLTLIDAPQESTLVVSGEGRTKFNIWVREPTFPLEDVPVLTTVAGVEVRGGEYLVWRAQGQVVSLASYGAGWRHPDRAELASLVRATLAVTYPGK